MERVTRALRRKSGFDFIRSNELLRFDYPFYGQLDLQALISEKRTKLNLFIHYFNISSNQKVPEEKFERPISLGAYHVNSGSSSKVARTCGSRSKVPVITSYSQLYLTDKHSRSKIFSPSLLIISKRKTFST